MSETTGPRTPGFLARLEGRLEPLLGQVKQGTSSPQLNLVTPQSLAAHFEGYVARLVSQLIENRPMQQAVLDRSWLAEHWSLLDHDPCEPEGEAVLDQISVAEYQGGRSPHPPFWPPTVSPADLGQALRRTGNPDAILLAGFVEKGLFFPHDEERRLGVDRSLYTREALGLDATGGDAPLGDGRLVSEEMERALRTWPVLPCARVVAVHKMVLSDLRKPAIAIDAGKVHHEMMSGWSRSAKESRLEYEPKPGRVELVLPGTQSKVARLLLPIDSEGLSEAFVEAIREWRSFIGLRHWIALQSLFSIQGKREGRVLWKLDDHLEALGISQRWREDPDNRASVVREVSLLSKMQLVVYRPDGSVRARHNVLMTKSEIDVKRGGEWLVEGLELEMHPWLYSGVRDQKTGQLGKNWHPAPPELAKIDHNKFPYALVLGLMLPMRWKWVWAQSGADHLCIEASKLLDMACIQRTAHDPGRAWDALDRNLAELERIKLLGQIVWEGEHHTLAAKLRLYPAEWLLDRTVQGLHAIEKAPPPTLPSRGGELAAWRKARGWTQAQLARMWEVGERTIRRAEDTPDKLLGPALTAALRTFAHETSITPEPSSIESTVPVALKG